MSTYRIENTIVNTENASKSWPEGRDWDGSNWISRATGGPWEHETLYRSRKGRYYVELDSDWQGSISHAEWVSPQEATRWLLRNEHELPADLQQHAEEVSE